MSSKLDQAQKLIPAEIRMFSGCRDDQTSADVQNVATFQLPDPAGRAGGACTSALLEVLYSDKQKSDHTYQDLLLSMRDVLEKRNFAQVPQLTASRPLDIQEPFTIVPDGFSGNRYAVMIGINYVGQNAELSGCQNDVGNMIEYLKDVWGFSESDMNILMDDGEHTNPTKANILSAYSDLVSKAQPGDVVFCHYSGHGGKLADENGDEKDGYDETLVPVDYDQNGQIRDDDLFKALVGALAEGVTATLVMDCCHSGSVLDLPYTFVADGTQDSMKETPGFNLDKLKKFYKLYQAYKQGESPAALVGSLLQGESPAELVGNLMQMAKPFFR